MPAPLCAVCGWFDLAFDLLRVWGPLVFFGIPTELTVKEQSRFFCRMWGCLFLAKSFLAHSNIRVVAIVSAMGSDLVRPAEKSRLILLGKGFRRALQQRQKVWRKVYWQRLAEAWASRGPAFPAQPQSLVCKFKVQILPSWGSYFQEQF